MMYVLWMAEKLIKTSKYIADRVVVRIAPSPINEAGSTGTAIPTIHRTLPTVVAAAVAAAVVVAAAETTQKICTKERQVTQETVRMRPGSHTFGGGLLEPV
jgi:hypothetical protein